jgi:hypothetical protein
MSRTKGAKDRRKGPEAAGLRDLARQYTTEAFECALSIMRDPDAPAAAKATVIGIVFDRGYGKPAQDLNHGSDPANPIRHTHTIEFL